jgi:hypothetical protein
MTVELHSPMSRPRCPRSAISSPMMSAGMVDAFFRPGLAERGVAIPNHGDYVRVWRSRELERSGKLRYTDTLSTELGGSTIRAQVTLFAVCRLQKRWSGLGGSYNEIADTRLHPLDCACWD